MAEPKFLTVDHLSTRELTRIFSKIKVNHITECWEWTGLLSNCGYGRVCLRWHQTYIHRLMYAWLVEPIPNGQGAHIPNIDHLCEVHHCCNPSHLQLSTPKANALRGNNVAALNARKTHCKRGHLLPESNPARLKGRRRCMICNDMLGRLCRQKPEQREKYLAYNRRYNHARKKTA